MAISSFMTSLKYGSDAPTTQIIIKDFPSLLGKRNALETTTLSDDAQTFIQGIRAQSESFDFTANYDPEVYAELNSLTTTQMCSLTFGDGSGYTWEGYLSASVNEGSVDAVIEMTISIVPSTVPIWAAEVK